MDITRRHINRIAYETVGCAIEVHKHLGPGLLESIYEQCMIVELRERGLTVASQVPIPIFYKGKVLKSTLVLDLLVDDLIIVELKAVEVMLPVFKAQLLSYLRLTGKPKGLLINFHCDNIVKNLVPLVTEEFAKLEES